MSSSSSSSNLPVLSPRFINNSTRLSVPKFVANNLLLQPSDCIVNNFGSLTLSGSISGTRGLVINGNSNGLLTLTGNVSYTGTTRILGGRLKITGTFGTNGIYAPNDVVSIPNPLNNNGATTSSISRSPNQFLMNSELEYASSSDLVLAGHLSIYQQSFFGTTPANPNAPHNPNKKVIVSGTGRLTWGVLAINFDAAIEVNNGFFRVGNNNARGGILLVPSILVAPGATLEFNRTDTYDGPVTARLDGSGNIVLMTGSLGLSGIGHTFSGSFTINNGSTLTLLRQMPSAASFVNNGTMAVSVNDPGYWDVNQLLLTTTFNNSTTTYGYLNDWTAGTAAPGDVTGQIQSAGLGNDMSEFAGFVPGRIALVQRGVQPFQTKANNAVAAGAIGMIIYNNTTGITTPTVTSSIPVVMITQSAGQQILTNLNTGTVSARIRNTATGVVNFNNLITGTGTFVKTGSAPVILGNSVQQTLSVQAGPLRIASGATVSGAISVSSGAAFELLNETRSNNFSINGTGVSSGGVIRNLSGNSTLSGGITQTAASRINSDAGELVLGGTVSGAFGLTFGGAGNITSNGVLSTITGLTKDGAGRLVINGNNTFNGTTTLSAGVLRVGHASALGVATSTVSIPASTAIEVINGISFARNLSSAGTGVSSAGSLRSISGNNTFAGNYTLTAASRINSDADTLTLSSAGTLTGTFGLTFGGAGNINVNRAIATSTGAVTKDGTGAATFLATNTYSGTTTISSGTLQIGSNGTAGTLGTGNVVNNATLIFNRSNNNTISNVISGTGSFVHNGSGTTTLSGNNTYSGGTTINSGTLVAGSNTCFGTGPITVNAGATLNTAGRTLSNTIVNNGGTVINVVPWTPSQLGSNLAVWLDADDSSTITLNGSTVSQWRDKSVNARHLSQANAANQPTRTLNALNGGTALTFSGNQWLFSLAVSGLLRNVAGGSLTVVTNYTNAIQQRFAASVLNSLSTSRVAVFLQPTSLLAGGGRRVDSDAFTAALSATAYTNGTSVIQSLSLNFAENINSQFVNGSAAGTSTFSGGGNSSDTAALSLAVGCSTADGISAGNLMAGLVSEVVLTQGVLSTLDRQRLEGYLAHRWGLTANLPTDHPFKNTAPTT